MKVNFFYQEWLGFKRSPALTQNLLQTAVMAFFALYFAISLFVVGLVGTVMLSEYFPDVSVVYAGGTALIYYFMIDVVMRYFFQKFPTLSLKSYILLPIPKSLLIHFVLRRSLFSVFNLLPLCFLIPFFFAGVWGHSGLSDAVGFLILAFGLTFLSHFVSFAFAKAGNFKKSYILGFLALLIALLYLEFSGFISLFIPLSMVSEALIGLPYLWIIPLGLPFLGYMILYKWFLVHLSMDKISGNGISEFGKNFNLSWFDRFGRPGQLMSLELMLMLRSKRARSYFIVSLLFLLLPLLADPGDMPAMLLIYGILMTGMIALNHGQLMLSWNSLHFDLLISRGNSIHDLFSAKYYFLVLSCLLCFILTLPYYFFNPQLVLYCVAALTINCSSSIFAYMILASANSLRVDPNEGGAFSLSGFGAAHYLIGLPIVAFPLLIFFIGYAIGGSSAGLTAVFVAGLAGMVFHKALIQISVNLFMRNRYSISAAFRKKG